MRILFVLRGCIPVELQGPARFAKLHSEIMNVVRSLIDQTCYAGIRTNKKKEGLNSDTVTLMDLNLVYLLKFSPSLQSI